MTLLQRILSFLFGIKSRPPENKYKACADPESRYEVKKNWSTKKIAAQVENELREKE